MSLLVVGSIAYDTVMTPFGSAEEVLGGSCTFFSMAASPFVAPRLLGVVGDDFRPEDRDLLAAHGICLEGLHRVPGKTFRWGGRYEADGINRTTLFTHLNVFETFSPKLPETYRESALVFLANIHPQLQATVLDQVRSPRLIALDTMDLWIHTERKALQAVIERVDILFVNDSEASALTGQPLMARAAKELLAMGPRYVVIKRGEHGSMLWSRDSAFLSPALPLEEVFDPTGAGDSFAGGFMGWLANRGTTDIETLRQAMVMGTVMASFCVESFSLDKLAEVTRGELAARTARMAALTSFVPPPADTVRLR